MMASFMFVDVLSRADYLSYDQYCEEEEDSELWQDDQGTEGCDFGSDGFDCDEADCVICGPIG